MTKAMTAPRAQTRKVTSIKRIKRVYQNLNLLVTGRDGPRLQEAPVHPLGLPLIAGLPEGLPPTDDGAAGRAAPTHRDPPVDNCHRDEAAAATRAPRRPAARRPIETPRSPPSAEDESPRCVADMLLLDRVKLLPPPLGVTDMLLGDAGADPASRPRAIVRPRRPSFSDLIHMMDRVTAERPL